MKKDNDKLAYYLPIMISLGVVFGICFDNIGIGICLGVGAAGILSLFSIKKGAVTLKVVFTTTLSVTALFRISKPKKVIHYCMVNNLFIFQTHLKRTCSFLKKILSADK